MCCLYIFFKTSIRLKNKGPALGFGKDEWMNSLKCSNLF